jgi:hypothetical protein
MKDFGTTCRDVRTREVGINDQLNLRGADLVLDFIDTDFSRADITAGCAEVLHT